MARIPEDKVVFGGGEKSLSPASGQITFAQAVEMNPGPDWYYWLALPSWTPEEAALLFLSEDPHTSTFVRDNHRAFTQVLAAISRHGCDQNKPPREWAEILLGLPCFQGVQKTTHPHHPFRYLSEYFGDNAPTPHERISSLERRLAEVQQDNEALRAEVLKLRTEVGAKPDPRNLKTLKAIIAALACGGGDVEALRDRNLAGKIARSMGLLGVGRSDDAVRSALNQVLGFIEEEKEKNRIRF